LGRDATWIPAAIKPNALVNDIRKQLGPGGTGLYFVSMLD